ncbi:MAG: thiol:disulfide interchange protein DsbA/DsbL [Pseudomonadota bacterium]
MRFLRLLFAAVTLMASTSGAFAAEPKSGTDYTVLESPVRTEAGKKVEVTEFFMYSCPHCKALDPLLSEWVKKQGDAIQFRRVHFPLTGANDPQAHAYLTLDAMGKIDGLHEKIFTAIHVDRNRLNKDDLLLDFVVKNGVDKAQYLEYFNSFAVQAKMKRLPQIIAAYKVDSAPTIVIDGRFVTSPSMTSRPGQSELQSQQAVLQVMDALVAKAQQEKGGKPAPAAAPASTQPAKK